MLDLAKHILETKKAKFDPSKFEDRYETALKQLIKAKQAGKTPPAAPSPQPSNVINLMDALRRSVQGERRGSPSRSRRGRAPETRTGQTQEAQARELRGLSSWAFRSIAGNANST